MSWVVRLMQLAAVVTLLRLRLLVLASVAVRSTLLFALCPGENRKDCVVSSTFVWGFDCSFTNYNFRQILDVLKRNTLPEG